MNILGHGIDLIDVSRISKLMATDDFIAGWFTNREISQLEERGSHARIVAGRVAAKEACVKALGSGFDNEVSWQDVEILIGPNGAPLVQLSGGAAAVAQRLGVSEILVSVANESNTAIASAIAIGLPTTQRR